jgi:hypothetical protein
MSTEQASVNNYEFSRLNPFTQSLPPNVHARVR